MALVFQKYRVRVTFVESSNRSTEREYGLDPTVVTDAAARTAAAALVVDLQAITEAVVRGYSIDIDFVEDAFALPLDAELEDAAEITVQLASAPNKTARLDVPAAVDAIFVAPLGPGREVVDTQHTLVVNLVANFRVTGGDFTLSDGEFVTDATGHILKGKRISKPYRPKG